MPGPQSLAIRAGDWIFTSGLAREREVASAEGIRAETRQCLEDLANVLKAADAELKTLAKLRVYANDARFFRDIDGTCEEHLGAAAPARANVADGLLLPFSHVQVEATAYDGAPINAIRAELPPTSGRAAAGTVAGDVFFSNGLLPLNRKGEFVGLGNIRAQVEQSMDNLGIALKAAGFNFSDVVRIHNAVPSWFGFDRYNEIYQKYLREPFAVRATIQGTPEHVSALVQFEAIAARGQRKTVESEAGGIAHFTVKRDENTIYLPELPEALAPHSHAVQVGKVVYLCGEIGYDNTGRLVKRSDIRAQTKKTMENLALCMEAVGGSIKDIVKTNVSLTDARMIDEFFGEYAKVFDAPYPAMNVAVAGLAQDCMVIEVEAVAVLGASSNSIAVVAG
jgi:2-iminobutanoate/2-iminopropanoate deaminase